jgi:ubiquinone/menaquinone biosynthesis C-methylase UbiE
MLDERTMSQQLLDVLGRLRYRFDHIFKSSLHNLSYKQYCELAFWQREIQQYIKWYMGKKPCHYGVSSPANKIKVTEYGLKENAILTWVKAHINKYPDLLLIPKDYFVGKTILDVGCGPIPYVLAFTNCKIYGLDQLIGEYKQLGFPLEKHSNRLTYINGSAENIPVKDKFFDAVISVNALDHVDDFPKTAEEISRVLQPEGILRIETNYHQPTTCEPWPLSDELIIKHFGHLNVKKVSERLVTEVFPEAPEKKELLVVWTNKV